MKRTFKLALFVSLAAHAMVFATLRMMKSGESQPPRAETPRIVMLVPVTDDFIAKPVEPAPPPTPAVQQPPTTPKPKPPTVVEKPLEKPAPKALVKPIVEAKPQPVSATPTTRKLDPVSGPAFNPKTNVQVTVAAAITNPATPVIESSQPQTNAPPAILTGRLKYRRSVDPDYPALAKRRRQEGTVLLDVVIAPDGKPTSVSVKTSSSFPLLDKAAVEAVQRWEFDVTTHVPVRAEIPVRFELIK
jgi:protein TonB